MTLAILDIGINNTRSVEHAFDRLGVAWRYATTPADIGSATAIVLPGVGAFPDGMANLRARGLVAPLRDYANSGKPMLGICLGMQLMADCGLEHENTEGLALIPGRVVTLRTDVGERVPNIGWCATVARPSSRLMNAVTDDPTYYFVHSYHFECACPDHEAAVMPFGGGAITAAIENGMVFGVQFHPEKSQDAGMALLERFTHLAGLHGE